MRFENKVVNSILDDIYEKRIDKMIPRVVCANISRSYNLISNHEAEKLANELISESLGLGLDYYVAKFLKLEYGGKERLKEILEYIYQRYHHIKKTFF